MGGGRRSEKKKIRRRRVASKARAKPVTKASLSELEARADETLFVGRAVERELFATLLKDDAKLRVLHLVGPGGIGKSGLLRALERDARTAGHETSFVDARAEAQNRDGLHALLARAGLEKTRGRRRAGSLHVIFVDTAEHLAALESLLASEVVRRCQAHHRVVIAGRANPGIAWTTRATWGSAVVARRVGPLTDREANELLRRRAVPAHLRAAIRVAGRGYPLVLTLAADSNVAEALSAWGDRTEPMPELMSMVCDSLLAGLTPGQAAAIELASLVRTLDEDGLRAIDGGKDAHATFDWLRSLSIVETSARGVFLHDLARDAVLHTLKWRRPERFRELFRAAFHFTTSRAAHASSDAEFFDVMLDVGFLARHVPGLENGLAAPADLPLTRRAATRGDLPAMKALITEFEGRRAGELVEYWFQRDPRAFVVLCDDNDVASAMVCTLDIGGGRCSSRDRRVDPGVDAVLRHAELLLGSSLRHARIGMVRFMSCRGVYQEPSPEMGGLAAISIEPFFRMPDLKLYYSYYADAKVWEPVFRFAGATLAAEARFTLGGHTYDVAFHDRRDRPPANWLLEIAERGAAHHLAELEREDARERSPAATTRPATVTVDITDASFVRSVRRALRSIHDLRALAKHPFASSSLVGDGSVADRSKRLHTLLLDEIAALRGTSRSDLLFRVAHVSFVAPLPSQEHAAEALAMASSTFRRHLQVAVTRVASSIGSKLASP